MSGKGKGGEAAKKGKRESREILAILAEIAKEYADDYEDIGKIKAGGHGRAGQNMLDYEGGINYWD